MPIKGLEKGDGVPSLPCELRRDKLGRGKEPIQKRFFHLPQGYRINLYREQNLKFLPPGRNLCAVDG